MPLEVEILPSVAAEVASLQKRAELAYVFLLKSDAEWEGTPIVFPISVDATHLAEAGADDPEVAEDRFWFNAFVTVRVKAHDDEQNDCFSSTARYMLRYDIHGGEKPSNDHLQWFAKTVALSDVWPYARDLFTNLANRMEILLPPLPLLRVVETEDADLPVILKLRHLADGVNRKPKRKSKSRA